LITNSSLNKISGVNNYIVDNLKIPAISHHIYFTSSENPIAPNDYLLATLNNSLDKLNRAYQGNWKHYFWTNNIKLMENILPKNKNIIIKSFNEFSQHALYQDLFDALSLNKIANFSQASDLLRFMAIEQYGGIYFDMDYEIYNASLLLKLMHAFDFIGGRESSFVLSYYGSAFLAAKAHHPISQKSIELTLRNNHSDISDLPKYIQYPCYDSYKIFFNAPPLVTLSYFMKNNIENNIDIILPSWMIFNIDFARYKNSDCNYSKLSKNLFEHNNNNLKEIIKNFTKNVKEDRIGTIYYSYANRDKFPIIGADMFCARWSRNKTKIFHYK
jgi:hypothetical protein